MSCLGRPDLNALFQHRAAVLVALAADPCQCTAASLTLPWGPGSGDSVVLALSPHEFHFRWPIRLAGPLMSGSPPTVTEALRQLREKVCTNGPLPPKEEFAPLFMNLDIAWRTAHSQELSTQAFILHFSHYLMVRDRHHGTAP